MTEGPTFPHGESHDGSPGLDAFHKAKSLGDFFSLNLSAEMLRSPVETSAQSTSACLTWVTPGDTRANWIWSFLSSLSIVKLLSHLASDLLLPAGPSDLRPPLAPVWRTSAAGWHRILPCRSTLNRWIHICKQGGTDTLLQQKVISTKWLKTLAVFSMKEDQRLKEKKFLFLQFFQFSF